MVKKVKIDTARVYFYPEDLMDFLMSDYEVQMPSSNSAKNQIKERCTSKMFHKY